VREHADLYDPPGAATTPPWRTRVSGPPLQDEGPSITYSKFPMQPWSALPAWLPTELQSNDRVQPLWTFTHRGEQIAAILYEFGLNTCQARFYKSGELIRSEHMRTRGLAIQWADRQRGELEDAF